MCWHCKLHVPIEEEEAYTDADWLRTVAGSLCPGDVCLGMTMVLWIDAAVTTVAVASLKVPGRAGDHSDWQLGMQDVASARRRSDQTNSASS